MPAAYGTLGFIENKGQIPSTESNTTVLYYFETPDFNCYVTNHGLTYIFRERISKNAIREDYPDSSTTIKFSSFPTLADLEKLCEPVITLQFSVNGSITIILV